MSPIDYSTNRGSVWLHHYQTLSRCNTVQKKIPLYRTLSPILEPAGPPVEPGVKCVLLERLLLSFMVEIGCSNSHAPGVSLNSLRHRIDVTPQLRMSSLDTEPQQERQDSNNPMMSYRFLKLVAIMILCAIYKVLISAQSKRSRQGPSGCRSNINGSIFL